MAEPVPTSPRSPKVPYYVSDIVSSGGNTEESSAMERLHSDLEALDAETRAHLASRRSENDTLRLIRHSAAPTPVHEPTDGLNVTRSRSLEGLLGDVPGTPRDSVQVHMMSPIPIVQTPTLPARGRAAPPPPTDVPPLDHISQYAPIVVLNRPQIDS